MTNGAMTTEHVTLTGGGGDEIAAYVARPAGDGPFPGVVVIQHIFGVDEWIMEICRRVAHHGYTALAPNLYSRIGGTLGEGPGEELGARLRSMGGLSDDLVVGDIRSAVEALRSEPTATGKVGTIGFCMGGRYAYLAAGKIPEISASVDCWGGGVAPDPAAPAGPGTPYVTWTPDINAPLLGIFGNDDRRPDVAEVNRTEAALKEHGKTYEFHRYDGAGHEFFNWESTGYRIEQAQDGWEKVWDFYKRYL